MVIQYKFESLNNYINKCRTNPYYANKTKQKETELARLHFIGKKVKSYPIVVVFKWHMKSKTADLDGRLAKNILDGMVRAGTIVDDNVKYIQKIVHEYIPSTKDYVEVNIYENNQDSKQCMKTNCRGCKYETRCKE